MNLYATDYDGTLNCCGITDELCEAVRAFRGKGNLFGVISGRPLLSILKQLKKDGIGVDFLVANNGAVLSDGNGKILSVHPMKLSPSLARIAEIVTVEKMTEVRVDTPDSITQLSPDAWRTFQCTGGVLTLGQNTFSPVTEICAVYEDEETHLRDKIAVDAIPGNEITPLMPSPRSIDFISKDADKRRGLLEILSILRIAPEKILVTGDSHNDLQMLTAPEFTGYAVESARDDIKAAVGRTVPSPMTILKDF